LAVELADSLLHRLVEGGLPAQEGSTGQDDGALQRAETYPAGRHVVHSRNLARG
jgi:hypothetical protein